MQEASDVRRRIRVNLIEGVKSDPHGAPVDEAIEVTLVGDESTVVRVAKQPLGDVLRDRPKQLDCSSNGGHVGLQSAGHERS